MGKVNTDRYTSDTLRLTPEVVKGPYPVLLTVAEFRDVDLDGRVAPVLIFEEFPEHTFWANKQDIVAIVKKLGDDSEKWVGSQVPIQATMRFNPQTEEHVKKLHVVNHRRWDSAVTEAQENAQEQEHSQDDLPF